LRFLKGFRKDPFFYLGSFSIILFLVLIFASFYRFDGQSMINIEKLVNSFTNQKNQLKTNELYIKSVKNFGLESPDFCLVQKSSLMGLSSPSTINQQSLGSLISVPEGGPEANKEIIEYIVESGDTLLNIAAQFNISLETLLWANNLNKNSKIKVGQRLTILPVSGVIHYVKSGDTLSEIAKNYKADVGEIVAFNELSGESDIYIGDILIIPDGVMPPPPKTKTPSVSEYLETPLAKSYFIYPISPPYKITKGLHFYNAIDLTNGKCGSPIYAVAQGEVLKTKFGWNRGYGNYLSILHPNGVVTTYAHLQAILVSPGAQVSQGQIIGLMGGSPGSPGAGHSTGCHLHFEVHGAKNPFSR